MTNKISSTKNTIGNNLYFFRNQMKLSQQDLADYLHVKREMISYYENDSREIPLKHLQTLSDLFGIELIDLLEENAAAIQANIVFAFRADTIHADDLQRIAHFRKIVKNYVKINSKVTKNSKK